jgi:hypothetical protein
MSSYILLAIKVDMDQEEALEFGAKLCAKVLFHYDTNLINTIPAPSAVENGASKWDA